MLGVSGYWAGWLAGSPQQRAAAISLLAGHGFYAWVDELAAAAAASCTHQAVSDGL